MNWHSPDDLSVQQYLDGHLSLPDRRRFEQHLEVCPDCRSELKAAEKLNSLIQNWIPESEVPPAGLEVRIRKSIQTRPPTYRIWGLAAAALLLIVAGAHRLGSVASPTSPASVPPKAGLARSEPKPVETTAPALPLTTQQRVWTTGPNSSVVAFAGQVLTLGPQTRVHVESQRGDAYLLRLTTGSLRVEERGERIAVITPHLRVDPLGTDYQVTLLPGRSRVDLYTGKVRVTRLSDQHQQVLMPGGLAEVPARPQLTKPNPSPTPEVAAQPHLPTTSYPIRRPESRPTPTDLPPAKLPDRADLRLPVNPVESPGPWSRPWTRTPDPVGPRLPESPLPNWQQRRRMENWKRRQNLPHQSGRQNGERGPRPEFEPSAEKNNRY